MRTCQVGLIIVCSLCFVIRVESGTRPNLRRISLKNALLSYTCKSSNGRLCNNQGRCVRGRCECNEGSYGDRCEDQLVDSAVQDRVTMVDSVSPVPTETGPEVIACFGNNEGVCNGHGACINGTCLCEPNWAGITCELQNRVGFCETYRPCAECTALMLKCPDNCAISTNYQLVYDFPISGGTFHKCRYRSSEKDCRFFFQLAGTSATGVKTIMVKTCSKYRSTTPASITESRPVTSSPTLRLVTQEVTSSRTEMTSETAVSTTTTQKDPLIDDKDFCEKHVECAECTALFMICPSKCASMANYNLVFGFPRNGGESFHRCRFRNSERKCNFYFQLDNSRLGGLKNIMVKACANYPTTAIPPSQPKQKMNSVSPITVEVTTTDTDDVTTEDLHEDNENLRNKGTGNEGNVASNVSASANVYILCIVNLMFFTKYTPFYQYH